MLTPMEVQSLLHKLCVEAGFCLPSEEQEKLRADPPVDPIAFTNAVFIAEGLKPELAERPLYRGVHAAVVEFWRQRGYEADDTTPNNRRTER
jgi:hypothetical protein